MTRNEQNSKRLNEVVDYFNSWYVNNLNGVKLSFTGSIIKGYNIYFCEVSSGRIVRSIIYGANIKTAISTIATLEAIFSDMEKIYKPKIG